MNSKLNGLLFLHGYTKRLDPRHIPQTTIPFTEYQLNELFGEIVRKTQDLQLGVLTKHRDEQKEIQKEIKALTATSAAIQKLLMYYQELREKRSQSNERVRVT